MGTIKFGAEQAVKNCVRLKPEEKVVMVTDTGARHIADEICRWTDEISPGNTTLFMMEDYGERFEDGLNPLKVRFGYRVQLRIILV